jgi:hypothetical protein
MAMFLGERSHRQPDRNYKVHQKRFVGLCVEYAFQVVSSVSGSQYQGGFWWWQTYIPQELTSIGHSQSDVPEVSRSPR